MDIHTRQLRYFVELAKCLNFTKAAMNLYIAQPALSQQIADLEKQLGVTLFIRNSRSVSLTPAGQILLKSCPDIFNRLENTQKQMLLAQAGLMGSLKIGFLECFRTTLPDILYLFAQQYPDIKLELYTSSLGEMKTALHEGNLDVVFGLINYRDFGEDAPSYQVLYQDTLHLAIRKDHPFVRNGCENHAMLNKETVFVLDDHASPKYPQMVQEVFSELGIQSNRFVSNSNMTSIMVQVDAGLGITIIPGKLETLAHENIAFIPIHDMVWDFGAIWFSQNQNAALPLFLDVLERKLDSLPQR